MINENKMFYKTIPEILNWIEEKSKFPWIFIDTETTGLGGPKKQQVTQVSGIAVNYNFKSNSVSEIGTFDDKIKLTKDTKDKYNSPGDRTKWVLSFNRYGDGLYKYKEEKKVLGKFFNFLDEFDDPIIVAQNASFDMSMICGRTGIKMKHEVLDTKMIIQLYYLPLIQKMSETDKTYVDLVKKIGTSDRDGGLISSSMSKVGPALGLNMAGYHDSLSDCRITINMYLKIVSFLKDHSDVDISKYQTDRIKIIRSN